MISSLGLIIAMATALVFASYGLLSRVLVKESDDPLVFSILYGIYATLFSFLILFIEPWRFGNITPFVLFLTFLATVFYGVFQGSEFFARKHLEASRLTILFQITPAITFLGSLLFLRETFSVQKTFAIILIVIGNIIAIHKHGGHVTSRGLLWGLVTVTALAFGYVADKKVFELYPLGLYIALTYGMPSLYASFFVRRKIERMKKEFARTTWKLPVLGLVSVVGYYLLLKTFELAEASVAVPLVYISTVLTALGGVLILKEKSSIPQKIFGAVFVSLGVILLQ